MLQLMYCLFIYGLIYSTMLPKNVRHSLFVVVIIVVVCIYNVILKIYFSFKLIVFTFIVKVVFTLNDWK